MKKVWKWLLLALCTACALCAFAACKKNGATAVTHRHTLAHYVEREATCFKAGVKEHLECLICKKAFSTETRKEVSAKDLQIAYLPHTEVEDEAIEPTCTTNGRTAGKHCSVCGLTIVKQEVIPAGHKEVVTDRAVAPTCTESGLTEGRSCSVCNTVTVKQEVIPATGHKVVIDKAVASTCTEHGLTEGKHCSVCDTVLEEQKVVSVTLHTWTDKVCAVCGIDYYTEGLDYQLSEDGNTYSVSGIGKASGDIIIPSVYLGKPVIAIEEDAFFDCTALTGITIPNSVESIDRWAFVGCGLASIKVESGNNVYHSEGDCLIETATNTLVVGCKNSIIPEDGSVTKIGNNAFAKCIGLTNIAIPDVVTEIDYSAFQFCINLTGIAIPNGVELIAYNVFYACKNLATVTMGDRVERIMERAFASCIELTSITIPNSVKEIDDYAFCYCYRLSSLTIGSGAKSIGEAAFASCTDLTSVTVPDNVLEIRDHAFRGCSSLTSVTIEDGVRDIYQSAFSECAELSEITIPNSVDYIGDSAFRSCSNLASVTIGSGVTYISTLVFEGCNSLTSITVDSENKVYHSAGNCIIETATKTLIVGCKNSVIPTDGSVTTIDQWGFLNCTGLTEIKIPKSITKIGAGAFEGCTNLTSIIFEGKMDEWNLITKRIDWNKDTGVFIVHCSDGDLDKDGNEIESE